MVYRFYSASLAENHQPGLLHKQVHVGIIACSIPKHTFQYIPQYINLAGITHGCYGACVQSYNYIRGNVFTMHASDYVHREKRGANLAHKSVLNQCLQF